MRVLLLGGTTEGRELTVALASAGTEVVESVAGRTAEARTGGADRVGGFGGVEGLSSYLRVNDVDAVVDATHPFAATITSHAARACAATRTPLVRLSRPSWAERGDAGRWIWLRDHRAAAAAVAEDGASERGRVLLAVGRQPLDAYRALPHVLARVAEAPHGWLDPSGWELRLQRGPFDLDGELTMFRAERISALVSKDSGGQGAVAKLDAAARLGIPVFMVARPPAPRGIDEVATTTAVLDWLAALRPVPRRPTAQGAKIGAAREPGGSAG